MHANKVMTYVVQQSQNPVLGIMEAGRINFTLVINNHLKACWVQPLDESTALANKCYEKALPSQTMLSFCATFCCLGVSCKTMTARQRVL
jgi:hypothetical protein